MVLRVQYFRNDRGKNFWEIIDTYRGVTAGSEPTKKKAVKKAKKISRERHSGVPNVEVLNTDGSYNRTIKIEQGEII